MLEPKKSIVQSVHTEMLKSIDYRVQFYYNLCITIPCRQLAGRESNE